MCLPLDINRFWQDDALAHVDNCFSQKAPQAALGIRMSDECVFAELDEPGDPWGHTPWQRRLDLNRRYNDKAEAIIGQRLLSEDIWPDEAALPPVRRIGEVFGGTYHFGQQTGEWLSGSLDDPLALEQRLDAIDHLDLADFMFPSGWEIETRRIFEQFGRRPEPIRHIRGPVTLAMSVYGTENLIFLWHDAPELFRRFSQTIADVILRMSRHMDEALGLTGDDEPHGFSFADDDCCLLTPEMYEVFGYPVLKTVFDHYCPEPGDRRYQHSDSAMGHLLPILGRLDLTGCNFGPTVLVDQIRRYLPSTCIDGCLAPFTFMNNDEAAIIAEVRRDCDMIRASGTRGLNVMTAGSINNGSRLTSLRAVMAAIQNYGCY
ncbi:MAG: hypothetical protein EOM13_03110 [Clostridia bacterium]|nr:uroporphyrinogen decarboxylase family protein [Eubacteriales bacterium]MDD3867677.1 uroporphyrinogen decarboxylase family protein [Eubacteriales bacterium]MDD4461638.1 uroporphyrinogen decarboxylase family protein [Eubacteriales bacterium]NCC48026.1 hypothetical protein [Clostridia bacterium]